MTIVFESLKEKRYCLVMVLLKLFLSEPEINVEELCHGLPVGHSCSCTGYYTFRCLLRAALGCSKTVVLHDEKLDLTVHISLLTFIKK